MQLQPPSTNQLHQLLKAPVETKTCNNSLSSLNSNASDTTIFESPSQSTPFESKSSHKPDSLSTDTLVEDKLFLLYNDHRHHKLHHKDSTHTINL